MAIGPLIFLALLALVHHPPMVSNITDSATLDRLQKYEKRLATEMGRLEVEDEPKRGSWDTRETWEEQAKDDLTSENGNWDGWLYIGLAVLVVLGCCRHSGEKELPCDSSTDSSSTTTNEDCEEMDVEPEWCEETKQKMLEAFYNRHLEKVNGEVSSLCDFMEAFVNDLIEEYRDNLPPSNMLPLMENCIGVGSAFEGWSTENSPKNFCILVPILPPKGHSFRIETSDSQAAPSKHGHILVDMECMCKRQRLLKDIICFLHHPEEGLSKEQKALFLVHVLCTSSHLDVKKTTNWFQDLISKVWHTLAPKYNFNLTVQPSTTNCQLKLEFQPRGQISIDILLGVQQGDSLVFLVTQGDQKDSALGPMWHKSFAIQELLFFKWVGQRAPRDSCHLKCLQILVFFKDWKVPEKESKNLVLTNYHYKTCLMHLLLLNPMSYWEPEKIAPRLQDILFYMSTALKEKYLEHFLIGNMSLPIQIPIPNSLRSAVPLNLFEHLDQSATLHAKAMKEFVKVVDQVRALFSACEE